MLKTIFNTFANCFKIPELKSRIFFTLVVLAICRVAAIKCDTKPPKRPAGAMGVRRISPFCREQDKARAGAGWRFKNSRFPSVETLFQARQDRGENTWHGSCKEEGARTPVRPT